MAVVFKPLRSDLAMYLTVTPVDASWNDWSKTRTAQESEPHIWLGGLVHITSPNVQITLMLLTRGLSSTDYLLKRGLCPASWLQ